MPKSDRAVIMCILLLLSLSASQIGLSIASDDWLVENQGGHYSETDGTIHVWTDGGTDCPSIILWKQISPEGNFSFSVKVNAQTSESSAIWVRRNHDAGAMAGFNFEFGHYDEPIFQFVRDTTDWKATQIAVGEELTWYTMKLDISASPFLITASVLTDNGTCIGTVTTSDITDFDFQDIKYIGIGCWGYMPADYMFRDVSYSLENNSVLAPAPIPVDVLVGVAAVVILAVFSGVFVYSIKRRNKREVA